MRLNTPIGRVHITTSEERSDQHMCNFYRVRIQPDREVIEQIKEKDGIMYNISFKADTWAGEMRCPMDEAFDDDTKQRFIKKNCRDFVEAMNLRIENALDAAQRKKEEEIAQKIGMSDWANDKQVREAVVKQMQEQQKALIDQKKQMEENINKYVTNDTFEVMSTPVAKTSFFDRWKERLQ